MKKEKDLIENRNLYNIYIRPIDLLLTNLFVIVCFIIFFRPYWYELVYTYVADFFALFIIQKVGLYFFLKKHGEYKPILPFINDKLIDEKNSEGKRDFIRHLFAYPHNRSIQIFKLSFFKVLVGGFIIVHLWHRDNDSSLLNRWIVFWVIELLGIQYFASCTYIELQNSVYDVVKYLQKKENWVEILSKTVPIKKGFYFSTFEGFSLSSISIYVVGLTTLYLYQIKTLERYDFIIVLVIFISGTIFIIRTYFAFRSHFFKSFNHIYQHFENFSPDRLEFVPFHVIPDLTKFEVAYNNLIENLIEREKALSRWLAHETEQGQVRLLGEITGLVAHDLSGPLNAINFCVEELKEKITNEDIRFVEHLDINAKRINELVDSLKAQIKNPTNINECKLDEVYRYTIKVLSTQFRGKGFEQINLHFDSQLDGVVVLMSRINLGHILYNFIKNAMENLMIHRIHSPKIELSFEGRIKSEEGEDIIVIRLCDNGTGLEKNEFDEMTSLDPLATFSDKGGLGLRLTRRLIENKGGKVIFVDKKNGTGTCYEFQFKEKGR